MGIESNKEAYQMVKNTLGSIENRFREAYNKGYKDGLRDGASQVTAKLVSKILEETEADTPQTEQTEPSEECKTCEHFKYRPNIGMECEYDTFEQTDCDTCRYGQDKHRYAHICNECGVGINNYTPQTECRTCKWAEVSWTSHYCDDCKDHHKYEPNDTPQTDCAWREPDE